MQAKCESEELKEYDSECESSQNMVRTPSKKHMRGLKECNLKLLECEYQNTREFRDCLNKEINRGDTYRKQNTEQTSSNEQVVEDYPEIQASQKDIPEEKD